jgi:hypothetical protein
VGQDFYEAKLNTFDPDLAEALTEADHQFMRAETALAELEYYKACNDPNGFHGPQLKEMHDRLNAYKQQLEDFEKSQARQHNCQQQQPVPVAQPMTSLAQGLHNNPEDELEETPAHPYNYLEQAILSDITIKGASKDGVTFVAILTIPDSNTNYMINIIISPTGQKTLSL